jgi:predicted phosphodiesterase
MSDPTAPQALESRQPSRRRFLTVASAAALAAGGAQAAATRETSAQEKEDDGARPLLDSPPVLQNPGPRGVNVVWAVNQPATGWVEYGETPELGRRADAPVYGLNPYGSRFFNVRLAGLTPNETVYYRVAAAPVRFKSAYKIERGEAVLGPVYRWTPRDEKAERASFAVINDTHERAETLAALTRQLAERPADLTIWNGDVFNDVRDEEQIVAQVLRPAGAAYAAERPVLFTSGNHDVRGVAARELSKAISPWSDEEPLGHCFAVRQGPLALVGLDTGEDKPDRHPVFAGLANFEAYREAQRDWLAAALRRPEIASAPYLVTFCHIPLWGLPGHNGGDTLQGFAFYCKQAQQLWHPLLAEAGAQLLISGHMHHFRYDAPSADRPYGQIVGGGPQLERATLIRGRADGSQLEVVASDMKQKELGRWQFAPRKM